MKPEATASLGRQLALNHSSGRVWILPDLAIRLSECKDPNGLAGKGELRETFVFDRTLRLAYVQTETV